MKNKNKIIIMLILVITFTYICSDILFLSIKGIWAGDLYAYWQCFAYIIRGYNQSDVIVNEICLQNIGLLNKSLVLPFSSLIGNIICPGFLDYKFAIIYYYLELCTVAILCIILIYKKVFIKIKCNKREKIILSICTVLLPWYWYDTIQTANIGGLIALLCIIAILVANEKPMISSFLFAITFIKPQISALFLVMLFLQKKYRIVFYTVTICAINLIIDNIYVLIMNFKRNIYSAGSNSIEFLLKYVVEKDQSIDVEVNEYWYYGIFDPLRKIGLSETQTLLLSAAFGIILTLLIVFIFRKKKDNTDDIYILAGVAAASMVWFYKSPCDNMIIILFNAMIVYYSFSEHKDFVKTLLFLIIVNSKICKYGLRFMVPMLDYSTGVTGDLFIILYIFIHIARNEVMRRNRNIL